MALPSSGTITSEMVRVEYGGSLPFRIQDYYRGGPRVPNTAGNSGVPTSGPISLRSFLGQNGGGGSALTANNTGASGFVFQNEPAPATRSVTGSGSVSVSGGSGSYTCTWSHVGGSASIPTPGANNFNPSFTASVGKNSTLTAVKRCTVSDGVNSPVSTDMSVSLQYSSDI